MKQKQTNLSPSLLLGTTPQGKPVILTGKDFTQHKHIIGISGSGKSSLLASIALLLLRQGVQFFLIDPHGDLAKQVLSLLASGNFFSDPRAYDRLWYVDFGRKDSAVAMNVLKQQYDAHTVAANVLAAIHRAFPMTTTTASMDNVLLASALALSTNHLPLTSLNRFLLDSAFRSSLLTRVGDPLVVDFLKEKLDTNNAQLTDSALRRSFLLTFSPVLRNSLGQRENKLDFVKLLNETRTSCLLDLGGLDEQTKRLIGSLLMIGMEQAFLARASLPPEQRTPAHIIVDEFPLFSASEDSFAVVLEQVRKYGGTLYLAHQTTSQLSKGITGSLQNALSIVMRLGYEDSTWAAQRFARPEEIPQPDVFDRFLQLHPQTALGPFAGITNLQQIKQRFETLARQEVILTRDNTSLLLRTPTLPTATVEAKLFATIETTYATRLLTPLSRIAQEQQALPLGTPTVAHPSASYPTRSVPVQPGHQKPFQFLTGSLEDDLMMSLYHFHYLTLPQIVRLLQKESSSNYLRGKLKTLAQKGLVETTTLARNSSGKPPTVYFLSPKGLKHLADTKGVAQRAPNGEKKHGFLEHTLAVSDVLIQAVLLPRVQRTTILVDLKHERTLKIAPVKVAEGTYVVPDGLVRLQTQIEDLGICFEIDRNTEDREKIQQKIRNYCAFAQGPYQRAFGVESLTIAFCVTEGGQQRVKQLLGWAEQTLAQNKNAAALFLFGEYASAQDNSTHLFLETQFGSPYKRTPHTMMEISS